MRSSRCRAYILCVVDAVVKRRSSNLADWCDDMVAVGEVSHGDGYIIISVLQTVAGHKPEDERRQRSDNVVVLCVTAVQGRRTHGALQLRGLHLVN